MCAQHLKNPFFLILMRNYEQSLKAGMQEVLGSNSIAPVNLIFPNLKFPRFFFPEL